MTRVNPPPQLPFPDQFRIDHNTEAYVKYLERVIFQLWERTGGAVDIIADVDEMTPKQTQAAIIDINNRIGSGCALTSDETGFTVDLTYLTVDMTEA